MFQGLVRDKLIYLLYIHYKMELSFFGGRGEWARRAQRTKASFFHFSSAYVSLSRYIIRMYMKIMKKCYYIVSKWHQADTQTLQVLSPILHINSYYRYKPIHPHIFIDICLTMKQDLHQYTFLSFHFFLFFLTYFLFHFFSSTITIASCLFI
jgi:hypothetical protein